jgi:hypothetical protein
MILKYRLNYAVIIIFNKLNHIKNMYFFDHQNIHTH